MGRACLDVETSMCSCPDGYYYHITTNGDSGCILEEDCPDLGEQLDELPDNIFTYPVDDTECEYIYTLCTSDSQCDDGFECVMSDNNDDCIPLYCSLDSDCNIIEDECLDDCMGNGYGICTMEDTSEPDTTASTTDFVGNTRPGSNANILHL